MKRYTIAFFLLHLLSFSDSSVIAAGTGNDSDSDNEGLAYVEIQVPRDYAALADTADETDKIIMLEVSASYCSYCDLIEEEIIKPMLRSGDYTSSVLIRKLVMDASYPITDLTGNKTTPTGLAQQYSIKLTPTLLFLDAAGNEVSERIIGIYSLDFFGSYVDAALAQGLETIRGN